MIWRLKASIQTWIQRDRHLYRTVIKSSHSSQSEPAWIPPAFRREGSAITPLSKCAHLSNSFSASGRESGSQPFPRCWRYAIPPACGGLCRSEDRRSQPAGRRAGLKAPTGRTGRHSLVGALPTLVGFPLWPSPYGRRISLPVVARPSRRRWASAASARGSSRSMVRLSLPLATLSRTSPARHFNSSGVAA